MPKKPSVPKKISKKVAAKQSAAKKPVKKSNYFKRFINLIRHHKLVTFLLVLLMLFPLGFGYEKYKDWDNAQMIKGLARDFPKLVEEIEYATGLDLEEKVSCMTTTEKFGNGVRTCDLSVGYKGLNNAENLLKKVNVSSFGLILYKESDTGAKGFTYRNKDSCRMWFAAPDAFRVECIMAVRDSNAQLIKETFNE